MAMLTFTKEPPQVFEVPRLEDHLIDELFYQEDEIGEMRHTAFMIECGLEEDPPDGPDVPPVPWRPDQLKSGRSAAPTGRPPSSPRRSARTPPSRTASADDIEDLEDELSPKSREPRRKLVAAKSGTLHGMRKQIQKTHSADSIEADDSKSPARRERRAAPMNRKPKLLVKAKSGSLHGLREAARKVQEEANSDKSPKTPVRRKLVATKSGTLHGMQKTAEAAKKNDSPPKSPVRKLVVTKSGTLHGMRKKAAEAQKGNSASPTNTPVRRALKGTKKNRRTSIESKSSRVSESSNSESFDSSDGESDVSLETDEDVPKSPAKKLSNKRTSRPELQAKPPKGLKEKKNDLNSSQVSPKDQKRVFKNGRSVVRVAETSSKSDDSSTPNTSNFKSAREMFRRGESASNLLAQARAGNDATSRPSFNMSSSTRLVQSETGSSSPGPFQSIAGDRVRPRKLRLPLKSKSISALEIPPAFRMNGGEK